MAVTNIHLIVWCTAIVQVVSGSCLLALLFKNYMHKIVVALSCNIKKILISIPIHNSDGENEINCSIFKVKHC